MDNLVMDSAMSVQLDSIYNGLEDNPNDWDLWGILGDLYYEMGDTIAEECIRWQVVNHKRPLQGTRASDTLFTWYDAEVYINYTLVDKDSDLPEKLFLTLKGYCDNSRGVWSSYLSVRCAEEALIQAWKDVNTNVKVIMWTDKPRWGSYN